MKTKLWKPGWLLAMLVLLSTLATRIYVTTTSVAAEHYHVPTPYSEYPNIWLPSTYELLSKKDWQEKKELQSAPHLDLDWLKMLLTKDEKMKFFLYLNNEDEFNFGSIRYYALLDGYLMQSSWRTFTYPREGSYHIRGHASIQEGKVRVDWVPVNLKETHKFQRTLLDSITLAFFWSLIAIAFYYLLLQSWNPFRKKYRARFVSA